MIPLALHPCWKMPTWHSVTFHNSSWLSDCHSCGLFCNWSILCQLLWLLRTSPTHNLKKKGSSAFPGNFSRGSIKATILLAKQNNPAKPLSGHLNPVYRVVMATIQECYAKTRIKSQKWNWAQGRGVVLRVDFPRSQLNCLVLSWGVFPFEY